ncbi:MAG: hypothetical protein MUE40_21370 [Anaerolineae bacterium]|jgi:hypothetical protein|nr:hypothetical protein [Anaerolineae bacterium]
MALLNLTRGGLTPAKLTNLSTSDELKCMFNPFEYTISKSNSWSKSQTKGVNVPVVEFTQGGPQVLRLSLYFDTMEQDTDVRKYTEKLWKMMLVDESRTNRDSAKSSPPPVAFEWGRLYFKAIITSMSQKFILFNTQGVPVRVQVDLTLEQYIDDSPPPQLTSFGTARIRLMPGLDMDVLMALTVAATVAIATAKVVVAVAGDRMDHVANNSTGDSNNMREVAERNNVDNPLRVQNGQTFS